jgi:DHA1 family bicyclomycin/chloramphenicol resistance-like MFS transporter
MSSESKTARAPLSGSAARRLIYLLIAMTAVGPTSLNILVPAVPGIADLLKTDLGTVQLTISLYLVGLATAQLLLGPLSDRFGRRPVILAGFAVAVLTSLAAIAATSISALIVARAAQAIGASTGIVVGRAIIRDLYDRDRAAAMIGLVATAMIVAPMIAPLIGGVLDTAFGWESIFIFLAAISLMVLIWAALDLPETRPAFTASGEPIRLSRELAALARSKSFTGYVLCASFGSAPFFAFLGGAPYVVVNIMGRTSAEYGIWFAVTSVGYMGGNFIASRWSPRFGVDKMIWLGMLVSLVAAIGTALLIALFPQGGPGIIFVPQTIISLGNGLLLPNAIAGAVSVRPQIAGAASGVTGFTQMIMAALIVQGVGYIIVGATSAMPIAVLMIALSLAGVASVALVQMGQKD